MAQDRTGDLAHLHGGIIDDTDLEDGDEFLGDFHQEVSYIREQFSNMSTNITQIKRSYENQSWANANQGGSNELHTILQDTNSTANDIRTKLKKMAAENKRMDKTTTEYRTRRNQLASLVKEFRQLVQEFDNVQTDYKDKYTTRVHRQAKIVNPNVTDDEVDRMIASGTPQNFFKQEILDNSQQQTEANNALIYIQEQHRDIKELEKSIIELNSLFQDMANLVEAQGEMLDSIESAVQETKAAAMDAHGQLVAAEDSAISSRKKCCIICIIITIVILIIIGIIAGIIGFVVAIG